MGVHLKMISKKYYLKVKNLKDIYIRMNTWGSDDSLKSDEYDRIIKLKLNDVNNERVVNYALYINVFDVHELVG